MSIEGMNSLIRKLNNLDDSLKADITKKAVSKATRLVQAAAKLGCPVDTGSLRNSIKVKTVIENGEVKGIVYTNMKYAPYVEFGTGPVGQANMPELPPEVASQITYSSEGWNTAFGHTNSQKPQPFLYPAIMSNKSLVESIVNKTIEKEIQKICRE